MKRLSLLEIKENETINRHRFQEHLSNIYTVLVDFGKGNSVLSIEQRDGESVKMLGANSAESEISTNQLVQLETDGANISLIIKEPGIYYCSLICSDDGAFVFKAESKYLYGSAEVEGIGFEHFLNTELPVSFEIGKSEMMIHDILSLDSGSIIELNKMVGEPFDIYVGEQVVAKGELMMMNDMFHARVIKLLPVAGELQKIMNQKSEV